MEIIYALIVGCLIGVVLTLLITQKVKPDGILRIDHSNPDKDTYRFEIDEIEKLASKNHIRLKVDNEADLSQK